MRSQMYVMGIVLTCILSSFLFLRLSRVQSNYFKKSFGSLYIFIINLFLDLSENNYRLKLYANIVFISLICIQLCIQYKYACKTNMYIYINKTLYTRIFYGRDIKKKKKLCKKI